MRIVLSVMIRITNLVLGKTRVDLIPPNPVVNNAVPAMKHVLPCRRPPMKTGHVWSAIAPLIPRILKGRIKFPDSVSTAIPWGEPRLKK